MFPGMNQRQMKQAMKQMGIQQVEIDAVRVIIECPDKKIIFDTPQVSTVNMMGQNMWQIAGESHEEALETAPSIDEEDVKTVTDQTGVSEEDAKKAIEDAEGDLAQAIMNLQD
ncbi:nascent polypeptide-associated complex protein [Candidatus Woesearchaeota archaeon]|nr:nascent polypeptide-associated complex protein [Candidatus Woesearchaeota archaeon]